MQTLKQAYDEAVARCVTVTKVVLGDAVICAGCDRRMEDGDEAAELYAAGIKSWWCGGCADPH